MPLPNGGGIAISIPVPAPQYSRGKAVPAIPGLLPPETGRGLVAELVAVQGAGKSGAIKDPQKARFRAVEKANTGPAPAVRNPLGEMASTREAGPGFPLWRTRSTSPGLPRSIKVRRS